MTALFLLAAILVTSLSVCALFYYWGARWVNASKATYWRALWQVHAAQAPTNGVLPLFYMQTAYRFVPSG